MHIAILGGTGAVGEGLALRWLYHTDHEVLVGSRKAERATAAAAEYRETVRRRGETCTVDGWQNAEAAGNADVVVLAIPPYHIAGQVEKVATSLTPGTVLVTPAVGMSRTDRGLSYNPPDAGSVTQLVADRAPAAVETVGAFHNLPADDLRDLERPLERDTLVVGDDREAKRLVMDLAAGIDGLRPLDAGPIQNAAAIESLTPLLINLASFNDDLGDVGIQFG